MIETATAACSVALLSDNEVLDARHRELARGHAEFLLPMIAELANGGRADRILVDCGPGSFTGIRVGVAAARALAFAWDISVTGYASLALLAASASTDDASVTLAVEGGHRQIYLGRYALSPLAELAAPRSLAFDVAVAAAIDSHVVGSAADRVVAARGWGRAQVGQIDARNVRLLPSALTALAPSPFYGREADAVAMVKEPSAS